jgi:hypothetical protein
MALLLQLQSQTTITWLWPQQEDWTGNLPVWSEWDSQRWLVFMIATKMEWVRLLCGSWDKLKLRDVCVSKLGLSFWQIACSFVAFEDGDLAKCLVTK